MDAQWQIAHTEPNISRASSLVIDGKFISIYCLFESISTQAERVLVAVSRHSKAAAWGRSSSPGRCRVWVRSPLISVSDKVKQNRKILG